MAKGELATTSATELARLVRERKVSPVEVIDDTLARIEALEPKLNAFVVLDREGARHAAVEAERAVMQGAPLGPLHGVPVSIKDITAVKGFPTRRGSRLSDPTPLAADSALVARLRGAGAVIVGKTTLPEHGWIAASDSPLTGATHNPWRRGFTAGGSSSGAAALAAAGCGPLHLGTDGAGSIRLPAHFCGVFGHKPTFGLVPNTPVANNNAISHSGPIARRIDDGELMLEVMAGYHPLDPLSTPNGYRRRTEPASVKGLRIAYSPDLGHARVDPSVAEAVARAARTFAELGATVETVTPPWAAAGPELERALWAATFQQFRPSDEAQKRDMDPGFVACLDSIPGITWREVQDVLGRRLNYAAAVNAWFADGWDLLLTPSASVVAFELGRTLPAHWPQHAWDWLSWAEFSYPFNLSHGPAASVPCGLSPEGLPIGVQIGGPRFADALVIRAAAAFLEAMPFDYTSVMSA